MVGDFLLACCFPNTSNLNQQTCLTLNIAACGSPSSWNGGLLVAISMMVQPRDQISAGAPYPRGPWSIISGAMYCRVPVGGKIVGILSLKNLSEPLVNERVNLNPLMTDGACSQA